MGLAYQCDDCGDVRTGKGFTITTTDGVTAEKVVLCPACAAVPKEYIRGLNNRVSHYTPATV